MKTKKNIFKKFMVKLTYWNLKNENQEKQSHFESTMPTFLKK